MLVESGKKKTMVLGEVRVPDNKTVARFVYGRLNQGAAGATTTRLNPGRRSILLKSNVYIQSRTIRLVAPYQHFNI